MSVANHPTKLRRGRWVTAAAVVLLISGVLGILYAPLLGGTPVWMFLGVGISALTVVATLQVATGIGLLRVDRWARFAAGVIAALGLALMQIPVLITALAQGVWIGSDWLAVAGSLIVLFAVGRRWPATPGGGD